MNQALFSRIFVSDDGEVAGELRPLFQLILQATGTSETGLIEYLAGAETKRGPVADPRGLGKTIVDPNGQEPRAQSTATISDHRVRLGRPRP